MRRAARVDANQAAIVTALRDLGAAVTPLHRVGQGVADLLISWRNAWHVFECKIGPMEKLTPAQIEWIGGQRAAVVVITSPEEAVRYLQAIKT